MSHESSKIGRTVAESVPNWPRRNKPAEGSPNVVFIVLDDTGFSHLGAYGSNIDTPNLDKLAYGGLRFTNFHTNSMCSPTRASLLTGRNAHAAGVSMVAEFHNGFPNTRGRIAKQTGTLAEILRGAGYNTIAVGKWHLTPGDEQSFAGPFDSWPTGRGFEHYYGFLNGETDQYHPDLVEYNRRVDPPATPAEGYHLTEDLTDKAISFVREQQAAAPGHPFFLYLSYGATHAPHQAPPEYLEKYRGKFDEGWDAVRERWFARQKELGVVPAEAELAPRNPLVKPWESLGDNEKRYFARLQEAFAGFLEHTDAHIGRLLDFLEEIGVAEDTVVVLLSDNGASPEGGPNGTLNEYKGFSGVPTDVDQDLARLDEIGTELTYNHYPLGWASAGNTPLKWYKTWVHAGGVRDPMIIRYPRKIHDAGGVRTQYHHVTDIAPTILELTGLEVPATIDGVPQEPLHGVSLAYTFGEPEAATRKETQYYEMLGHRAIWHDGWKAVTNHVPGTPFETDRWELYHAAEDFSESYDVSEVHPEKLQELVDLWWSEAERYGVLPIDGRAMLDRAFDIVKSKPLGRHAAFDPAAGEIVQTYYPSKLELHGMEIPLLNNRPGAIEAVVERNDPKQEGVLVADGNRFGGYALYVRNNRAVYHYNYFGERHYAISSEQELPAGTVEIRVVLTPTGRNQAKVALLVNGRPSGSGDIVTAAGTNGPGVFAVGYNAHTAVSPAYEAPFAYGEGLKHVKVRLKTAPAPQAERLVSGAASE